MADYLDYFLDTYELPSDFGPDDSTSLPSPVSGKDEGPFSFNEQEFQDWYAPRAEKAGISKDPDDPLHKYDYRAAYSAGAEPEVGPDGLYHWPSEFKAPDHPNRYVEGVDTITGEPARDPLDDLLDTPLPEEEEASIVDRVKDAGIDLVKGVVDVGRAAVGLAKLIDVTGLTRKAFDSIGYDADLTDRYLSDLYSEERKKEEREFEKAEGIFGSIKSLATRPAVLAGQAIQAAPGMLGIAGAARMAFGKASASAITAATAKGITDKAVLAKIGQEAGKKAAVIVAPAAEGLQQTGSSFDSLIKEADNIGKAYVSSIVSGVGTAAIAAVSGKLASKLKIGDIEAGVPGQGGFFSRIFGGAVQEGPLEEMPQSAWEQVWQNWATNRPLDEGLGKAAGTGALVGALMGGGMTAVTGAGEEGIKAPIKKPTEPTESVTEPTELMPLTSELIRSKYEEGAITKDDLEGLREIYLDHPGIVSSVDEILASPIQKVEEVPQKLISEEKPTEKPLLTPSEKKIAAPVASQEVAAVKPQPVKVSEEPVVEEAQKEVKKEAGKIIDIEKELKTTFQENINRIDISEKQAKVSGIEEVPKKELTSKQKSEIEDRIFRNWETLAKNKDYSEEELRAAYNVIEEEEFKKWEVESRRPVLYKIEGGPEVNIPKFKSTQEAVSFGENATPEQVSEMEKLRALEGQKSSEALKKEEWDQSMVYATNAQFYREAIEGYNRTSPMQRPGFLERPFFARAKGEEGVVKTDEAKRKLITDTIKQVQSQAKKVGKIVFVKTSQDLKKHGAFVPDNPRSVYIPETDVTYFVTDNIRDPKDAITSWIHEQVGHRGVMLTLKKYMPNYDMLFDEIYEVIKDTDQFKKLEKDYVFATQGLKEFEKTEMLVQEFIAKRAESLDINKKKSVYQKLRDYINNWMKYLFGEDGSKFITTMKDIDILLESSKKYVMEGQLRSWLEFKHPHKYYMDVLKNVMAKNPRMLTWYSNHQFEIKKIFGKDSDIFNTLIGITSPSTDVESNVIFAVKTYLYMHGKEDEVGGVYTNNVTRKVRAIQNKDWKDFKYGSYKVPEFTRALLGDEYATALDRWMKRLFFGDVILTKTRIEKPAALESAEATWLAAEVTAARHEIFRLAKELTDSTDRIWTPREVQAGLWIDLVSTSRGIDLESIDYDIMTILNKPNKGMLGGRTPIEYLKDKMGNDPIGKLHETIELPPQSNISDLEEKYRDYLKKNNVKPVYKYTQDEGGILPVIHFSKDPNISMIDPEFMGRGRIGAEQGQFKDIMKGELWPEFQKKSNFYVPGDKKTIEAHRFGRDFVYEGQVPIQNLYIIPESGEQPTDTELKKLGYKGYYNPKFGQVRLFVKVPVKKLGKSNIPMNMFNKVTGENFREFIDEENRVTSNVLQDKTDGFRRPLYSLKEFTDEELKKSYTSYSDGVAKSNRNKNILVKSGGKSKQLLVQITSAPAEGESVSKAEQYYNDLYDFADGYYRPFDFWETPEWAAQSSYTMPDADLYVVRSISEARQFLDKVKYDAVLFSAMDANKKFIKDMINDYDGLSIIGGYVDTKYFEGIKNVKTVGNIEEATKIIGVPYKDGFDYKHYKGTKTVPRLELSRGCFHNCAFCSIPTEVVSRKESSVQQQLKAFEDLDFELIYLNDKTFGQASNYKSLSEINKQVRLFNPKFKGFIIQTTAPQFNKLDENWLKESGIAYVELGVESYNDSILSKINKPHRTKTIDTAVDKLRRLNIKFIPNIMVGLAGRDKKTGTFWSENKQTYENTKNFLDKNKDIISHTNTYVLATYKGTELEDQLGVDNDSDTDENIVNKSWMKNPKVHEKFYEDVLSFGSKLLREKAPIDERVQYQVEEEEKIKPLKKLTIKDLKSLPFLKKAVITQESDGIFDVFFPKRKRGFTIKIVKEIKPNEAKFETDYGRRPSPGARAKGGYNHKNKLILLDLSLAGYPTITHEFIHFLDRSGLLTVSEMQAIDRQANSHEINEGIPIGVETRARWLTHELKARELKRNSIIGKIVQKIQDIIDGIVNLFSVETSIDQTLREIESGAVAEREYAFGRKESSLSKDVMQLDIDVPQTPRTSREQRKMLAKSLGVKLGVKIPASQWKKELFGSEDKSRWDKIVDAYDDWRENWNTKVFDRMYPIRSKLGETAYMLHRLTTGVQGVVAAFMRHGVLEWDGKAITVNDKLNGFLEWYKSLGEDGENLLYWIALKRAEQLESQLVKVKGKLRPKELWITKAKRDAALLDLGQPKGSQSWEEMHTQFNVYNKSVLDLAEKAGLINGERRKQWEQHFYIPFYRILQDESSREEYLEGPVQDWRNIDARIRKLVGKEAKVGDPLTNVIKNWTHLISESMRNVARAEAVEAAKELGTGIIEEVDKKELTRIVGAKTQTRWAVVGEGDKDASALFKEEGDATNYSLLMSQTYKKKYNVEKRKTQLIMFGNINDWSILSYSKNGERAFIRVNDPELFAAMSDSSKESMDNMIMRMFSTSKRWLTYGATFGPAFRVRNMLRDTLHTAIISKSFIPLVDSMTGIAKAMSENPDFIKFAASGAAFGSSYVKAEDAEILTKFIKRVTSKEGKGVADRIIDSGEKLLNMWEKIGSASENAARVALYTKRRAEGKSHLEAAFESRDLLDFTMHGSSPAVQMLIRMVPFMNARMQGLYKLGKAAKGNPKSFFIKGGLVTAASLMLWAANKDDDRYKELEDWDKWTYYHFWIGDLHFRIPKPFEVGAIFSSLFESAADSISDNEEMKYVADFMMNMFLDTFAMNPLPQIVKPVLEQWANKSFFTGRPIESQRLAYLKPGARKDPWTSETLQLAGKLGISPKRAEALIKGYFSSFGMFILGISDSIVRNVADFPDDPKKRIGDYFLIGDFLKDASTPGNTKYTTRFYESMRKIDEVIRTVNDYKNSGKAVEARDLQKEFRGLLKHKTELNKIRRDVGKLNTQIRKVYEYDIAPEDKSKRLDKLREKRNNMTRKGYEIIMRDRGVPQSGPKPLTLREAISRTK